MANNLDRLFREGVDPLEVTPKAESWQQVQSQIGKKKKAGWLPMSIAAAIILAIAATFVVKNYEQTTTISGPTVAGIDHPTPAKELDKVIIPEDGVAVKQPVAQVNKQLVANNKQKTNTLPVAIAPEETMVQYETIEVMALATVSVSELPATTFDLDFELNEVKKPSVKITYIAQEEANQKKSKLNEFISNISKDASPVEILADIRDAKDQIFSRN